LLITRIDYLMEPADDAALQNSQRRERRLQYVPYLWAALT
jgi:hypothetical protein